MLPRKPRVGPLSRLPLRLVGPAVDVPGFRIESVYGGSEDEESHFALGPASCLTFLSDGIVEARSASGELFGFERTQAISTQSAEEIARAAQEFGQEDDVTVLTLTFAPAEVVRA